jgi:hypothetical protein
MADTLKVEQPLSVYRKDWTPYGVLPPGYTCDVVDIVQDERGLCIVVSPTGGDAVWLVAEEDSGRFRLL